MVATISTIILLLVRGRKILCCLVMPKKKQRAMVKNIIDDCGGCMTFLFCVQKTGVRKRYFEIFWQAQTFSTIFTCV